MMYVLDLKEMRKQFDSRGAFEFMSDNDKVLMTFLLYNEFEREYAFLLTTNKIKFNIDFNDKGKFNFGSRLQDLYDEMRKPADGLRDYAETFATYEKVRREKPIGNNQYIAYTKRLQEMQKKRDQAGKMARMHVKAYMEKLSEELTVLLEDLNSKQEYVQNPQDILRLDNTIEGRKKLNGRKIYEAILLLYYYSSAFVYRLSQKGDLSGSIEYAKQDEDKVKQQISSESESTAPPPAESESVKPSVAPMEGLEEAEDLESTDDSKSILDELEDML